MPSPPAYYSGKKDQPRRREEREKKMQRVCFSTQAGTSQPNLSPPVGRHGQRFLLAVGFRRELLPTTTADGAVIVATTAGNQGAKPLASWFILVELVCKLLLCLLLGCSSRFVGVLRVLAVSPFPNALLTAPLAHLELSVKELNRDDPDLSRLRIHSPKRARSARSTWVERVRGTAVPLRRLLAGKSRS
jgi:hypothetical protein